MHVLFSSGLKLENIPFQDFLCWLLIILHNTISLSRHFYFPRPSLGGIQLVCLSIENTLLSFTKNSPSLLIYVIF